MRFEEALKAMREGKKVRKRCWYPYQAIWMSNGKLFCYDIPDTNVSKVEDVSENWILGEDWEVVL